MTRKDIIKKMSAYCDNPDDDVLRFKEKIKQKLLNCPELLFAIGNKKLETELFDKNGELNTNGDWALYFGEEGNIKPYLFYPDTVTDAATYLCYEVQFTEVPRYNKLMYYYRVGFTVISHGSNYIEGATGIAKHDLIGSIIREQFNWTNIFGTQIHLVSNKEYTTDKQFIAREMIFEGTKPNGNVQTADGITRVINSDIRR